MDAVERVRQLIEIMTENDLAELEVEEADLRVKIRKHLPPEYLPPGMSLAQLQQSAGAAPALQMPVDAARPVEASPKDEGLVEITSPMVGTFYRSSSPDAETYVSIGTEVDADTVVCIIEAMKVMNEIKADADGTVVEILVEDGEPIEFGQVLFLVEPVEE